MDNYRAFVALETNEEVDSFCGGYCPGCLTLHFLFFHVLAFAILKEPVCNLVSLGRGSGESYTFACGYEITTLEFFSVHYGGYRTTGSVGRLEEYTVPLGELVAMRNDVERFIYRGYLKYLLGSGDAFHLLTIYRPVRKLVLNEVVTAFHLERTALGYFISVLYGNGAQEPCFYKSGLLWFYFEGYSMFL